MFNVWIWELGHKESWALKKLTFWTAVLEKIFESPLDCKEIKPVNPKGNQSWILSFWEWKRGQSHRCYRPVGILRSMGWIGHHLVFYSLQAKNFFYIFLMVEKKIKRRTIFYDTWKLCEVYILVPSNYFIRIQPCSFIHVLSMAAFIPQ